jgi:serine/threonine protein kinase/Tfp pilus assembly protein PilF
MDPDRLKRLRELFDSAMDLEASDRPAFIVRSCGGDSEFQSTLESLIEYSFETGSSFDQALIEAVDLEGSVPNGPNLLGRTLGHHRIIEKIGQGGMGEVYRAEDTTLKRQVALKVLHSHVESNRERLQRFQREAETLATIDHPNIVQIYAADEADGVWFLTMQLVEGKTLVEHIPRGGMALAGFLEVAIPLAAGLTAAHEKGVIHSDLKPGNVMVTTDGRVKILDFGLAKLRPGPGQLDEEEIPTQSMVREGVVAGTVPYMSPEQIRGREVDSRSDIFSLGTVLYEAATGRRPFQGETSADLVSSILGEHPTQVADLRPDLPEDLSRIIRRCVEKDPQKRFQTALDVCNELEDLQRGAQSRVISDTDRPHRVESVAVLPFVALSGPKEEYVADGVTEALITDLAKLGGVKVISRTSVMRYKGSDLPLPQIARELGVQAVVEGSIQRSEDRLRVTAQLIEAEGDLHLWAESYERRMRDVLELQSNLARSIAEEVHVVLSPEEKARLAWRGQVKPEAHDLYLRSRHAFHRMTPDGILQSIRLLRKALDIDPRYVDAHVALSECYGWQAAFGMGPPRKLTPLSKDAALEALSLDDTMAKARAMVGFSALVFDWDPVTAQRELRRAVELSPNDPYNRGYLGVCLSVTEMEEEGIDQIRRAVELDPQSAMIRAQFAITLYLLRRIDEAIDQAHESLRINPSVLLSHAVLALSFRHKGRLRDSLKAWKSILSFQSAERLATAMERVYEKSGYEAALGYCANRFILAYRFSRLLRFLPASKRPYVSTMVAAVLLSQAQQKERCIVWLRKAVAEREPESAALRFYPHWDFLREDPRFEELVRRVGI